MNFEAPQGPWYWTQVQMRRIYTSQCALLVPVLGAIELIACYKVLN